MTSQHDPSSHHGGESNPIQLAIYITLGAVAVVIAIILLVNYAVGSYGSRDLTGDPSMSDKAVAKRIAPAARVSVDANAPAAASPATAAPAAAAAPGKAATVPPAGAVPTKTAAAGGAGKSTYDSACAMCHAAGVAGAPKLGDKAAWAPRLGQGMPQLYNAALKGKGAMPPKGGNAALSDDAVKAAVDFVVAAAK